MNTQANTIAQAVVSEMTPEQREVVVFRVRKGAPPVGKEHTFNAVLALVATKTARLDKRLPALVMAEVKRLVTEAK